MSQSSQIPFLPGGVGFTHLKVYKTGGSAHVHFVCTEAYCVTAGKGSVQTLSTDGFNETELEPGKLVWFSPGVIHRLINHDGNLEIMVVMQNSGLPEAGDFVLTFPRNVLLDSDQYFQAAALAQSGHVFADKKEAAYHRRDLAVKGFAELQQRFNDHGHSALKDFYQTALQLIQPKISEWECIWKKGPPVASNNTQQQLQSLQSGNIEHLLAGSIHSMTMPTEERKWGMCGTLAPYLPEGIQT